MRVNTNSSGSNIGEQGHYPFGTSWYKNSTTTKWQFTSYERDSESGLDYAIFRHDSSRLGRFMQPDLLGGRIANPQSLNRYAYVQNDPVNLIDPLGLDIFLPSPYSACFGIGVYQGDECIPFSPAPNPTGCVDVILDGVPIGSSCDNNVFFVDKDKKRKLEEAKKGLNIILSLDTECSKFFLSEGTSKDPVKLLEDTPIRADTTTGTIGAHTKQGTGPEHPIFVNLAGPAFNSSVFDKKGNLVRNPRFGSFRANTLEARITILAHELAHKVGAIPKDSDAKGGSVGNTNTILQECEKDIKLGASLVSEE